MKKLIILIPIVLLGLILTVPGSLVPQEKEMTDSEKFSAHPGILFKKTYMGIGNFGSFTNKVKLSILVIENLVEGTKEVGVTINNSDYTAYLDSEEISGLNKSLKFIDENVLNTVPGTDHTEFIFTSKGGFQAGCYDEASSASSDRTKEWICFVRLNTFSTTSIIGISKKDFNKIKAYMEETEKRIQELR